jgi:2-pyrone-4,6-dicarboxylate lactonase
MQKYQGFHPDPKTPRPLPPANTCDSQFHVFGPLDKYPIRPGAVYCTPEATIEAALRMHRTLGIQRGVIVQSSAYSTDFRVLYDALAVAGPNYQACVVIDDSVSDKELQKLHDAGVRGARFNFWKVLNLVPTPDQFKRSIARIEALGWYAKLHMPVDELIEMQELFHPLKLNVVMDHFGRPEFDRGTNHSSIKFIDAMLKKGNWWMMLSNGDRWSQQPKPWNDAVEFARHYVTVAPDRMIWGSDWPHPLVPASDPPKDDGELLELVYRYAETDEINRKILVDNPARLFGFKD